MALSGPRIFNIALMTLFIAYISVLLGEYFSVVVFQYKLSQNHLGIPENSATAAEARKTPKWENAARAGAEKRIEILKYEFLTFLGLGSASLLFIISALRTHIGKTAFSESAAEEGVSLSEILISCVFATVFILLQLYDQIKKICYAVLWESYSGLLLGYLVILLIILPSIITASLYLLHVYRSKFIVMCYIALFIRMFMSFAIQDSVNLEKMKRVPAETFSENVQSYLQQRGLQEKVYKEINPSDSVNAALVGWGKNERIEIYGNHGGFSDDEFDSIILHELGHSENSSLVKKFATQLLLKFLEMLFLVFVYKMVSKKYTKGQFSRDCVFFILYIFYLSFFHQWLFVLHKATSQLMESDSDLIAKRKGYGAELAQVLFKISVDSADYIYSTYLYNLIKSYHPAVYDRIEYLQNRHD